MNKRTFNIALLLLIVSLTPLFAGGGQEEAEGEEGVIELTWLQWWVNEWGPDNHAQLIADFEAQNPNIRINVVNVPWPDMAPRLQADAVGTADEYDILGMEHDWISRLTELGYLENLDPWLEGDPEFADSLLPVTPVEYKGSARALALYLIPYHFAYNVDIYESEGVEPPTDWDEFVAVMEEFRDRGMYGMSMTLNDSDFVVNRFFGYRLAQEGGRWIDDEGNVAINSDAGVRALQWWKDFYDMGLVAPGSMGEDQSAALEFVASGQVAGIIDGPFILTKAVQVNPSIQLAYAPPWEAGTGGYAVNASGLAMNANSPNKEAAWEFIKFMYSDAVARKMTETVSLPWASQAGMDALEGSDDPMLRYVPAFLGQDPENTIIYPALPQAQTLIDELRLAFQEVMAGRIEPRPALDRVAASWQAALDSE